MNPENGFESGAFDSLKTPEINKTMGSQENIKKPEILYHASSRRDLQEIKPRAESVRDPEEGPVVFGTPDIAYASCFLTQGTNDSWTKIASFSKQGPPIFICSDRKKFEERDRGGTIYKMNPAEFKTDPNKRTSTTEWVSKKAVTPTGRLDYDSALEAMLDNGVQVFFY